MAQPNVNMYIPGNTTSGTLPASSTNPTFVGTQYDYTLTGGTFSAAPQDVWWALNSGLLNAQLAASSAPGFPNNTAKIMAIPPTSAGMNWTSNGTVTAPDGTSITVTSGLAVVPYAWTKYYAGFGWTVADKFATAPYTNL